MQGLKGPTEAVVASTSPDFGPILALLASVVPGDQRRGAQAFLEISERADGPSAMIAAKNVIEPLVNFLKIDARYLQLVVSKTIANISKSKGGCAAIIAVGGISVLEGLLEKVQVEISAEAGLIQKNVEFALSRMREALPPAPVRQGSSLPVAEVMVRMQQSRRPGNNDCSMM